VGTTKQTLASVVSRAFGPEGLVGVVRHSNLSSIRLGAGGSCTTLAHVRCPHAAVDLVELGSAMLFEGTMPADFYSITAVTRCPAPGHSFNFSSGFVDGFIGFYPPGGQVAAMIPKGYANATLTVPRDRFLRAVGSFCPEIPDPVLRRGAGIKVPAAEFAAIRGLVAAIRAAIDDPDQPLAGTLAAEHLEVDLLAAFLTALQEGLAQPPDVRLGKRYQLLARARDLLDDHPSEPFPLARLCAELGLGRRSLEYLFNDLLGIGPADYLRRRRLHKVRAALLCAEPERGVIKRLALEWGFWHFGHFNSHYRALFGETPTCTLGRGSGRRRRGGVSWPSG